MYNLHLTLMNMLRSCLAAVLFFGITFGSAQAAPIDDDRDGLADSLESRLLEQFRPSFLISREDCDPLPAEMVSGEAAPRVLARNGTIYEQTTPRASEGVVPRNLC